MEKLPFLVSLYLCMPLIFMTSILIAQTIPTPTIIEVKEDDRAATVYWNSKTNTYALNYDPDKQNGIFSYIIEWGKVSEGFTNKEVTPYRVYMPQPLEIGVPYQARVYSVDAYGNKSLPSAPVQFQHSDVKVNAMRSNLTGFFDDFNLPMGPFDETKWNQSYSGCLKLGSVSQHINNQYHAHNVMASNKCDRGVASSRVRKNFDFTDRTGTIEFDLDGSKLGRQLWYLDLTPASRKRDLTGHVALEDGANPPVGDPAFLLRISEVSQKVRVQLTDENGNLNTVQNIYQNGACGNGLEWCPGENLEAIPNVRRHWKIELSKTHIKIFINNILVVDGSLQTSFLPDGLPYEVAQVNWLFFSYNTSKENLPLAMLHWDNFGFDGPDTDSSFIVHNYTDGYLGTNQTPVGNEQSAGLVALLDNPATAVIPIPDSIKDVNGADPHSIELMFCLQGGNYNWTASDRISINGFNYAFPRPTSTIDGISDEELINAIRPHSVIINIDANHLLTGSNQIQFFLNNARILNIHIELKFPKVMAPTYTPPMQIFHDYMQKLMAFKQYTKIGPGVYFEKLNGWELWQSSEFERVSDTFGEVAKLVKQTPVDGNLVMDISANMNAQLAATGHAYGITHIDILIDSQIVKTLFVNGGEAVAGFRDTITINTQCLGNGIHELFIIAYDTIGYPSTFDIFLGNVHAGEYVPIEFTVINAQNNSGVFYVNTEASGMENGLSWSNAYRSIQQAIDHCAVCDGLGKIWVAKGSYFPTINNGRLSTIDIKYPIQIFGGFNGGELNLEDRDFDNHITVLSGNIGIENSTEDNVYHVLTSTSQDEGALLDGFTIKGGNANGATIEDQNGAGIMVSGNLEIRNLRIEEVGAIGVGKAIYIKDSKFLTVDNSILKQGILNKGLVHFKGNNNLSNQ